MRDRVVPGPSSKHGLCDELALSPLTLSPLTCCSICMSGSCSSSFLIPRSSFIVHRSSFIVHHSSFLFSIPHSSFLAARYPVFPWVLADYTSSSLDLGNPSTFRDLRLPVGALVPKRLQRFREKFDYMVEEWEQFAYSHGISYPSVPTATQPIRGEHVAEAESQMIEVPYM